jgi:hypothetical protein
LGRDFAHAASAPRDHVSPRKTTRKHVARGSSLTFGKNMNEGPPSLKPLPPLREMSEPEKPKTLPIPGWSALLAAFLTGGGHAIVTAMEVRDSGGGIGYAIGSLFGALIFAPVVAAIVALIAKPLRSLVGFLTIYACVSLLALLGGLTR